MSKEVVSRPIHISPLKDQVVDKTESGQPIYETRDGIKYTRQGASYTVLGTKTKKIRDTVRKYIIWSRDNKNKRSARYVQITPCHRHHDFTGNKKYATWFESFNEACDALNTLPNKGAGLSVTSIELKVH